MYLVHVRLRKPRRVLTCLAQASVTLNRDETCIVQTDRGQEWGVCVLPPEPCPKELEERYPHRLQRRANETDIKNFEMLEAEEHKGFSICLEKIQKRQLPMKLVDVEYTFDKRKSVFYFTAEDRVDFRELVRDLAHELRTRIELRHIQVRDEAKLVGGLGSCGRELCCTAWLCDFKPISMRMAKRQNLSLNPSKISGQCGRLLCCLAYENDQYSQPRKKIARPQEPPLESEEKAPEKKPDTPSEAPKEQQADRPAEKTGGPKDAAPEKAPEAPQEKTGDQENKKGAPRKRSRKRRPRKR